jgi:hypothetical protein
VAAACERRKMRRNLFFILVGWFFISMIATGYVSAEDRSYTKYLEDDHGNEILKLTVRYLGKEPKGAFEWTDDVDWREKRLDFYTLEWANLTGNPIDFIKEANHLFRGVLNPESRGATTSPDAI